MSERTPNQTWRKVACGIGSIAAIIAVISAVCSWTAQFSLISDSRGDLSLNPLEGQVLVVGLCSAFITSVLGAFEPCGACLDWPAPGRRKSIRLVGQS